MSTVPSHETCTVVLSIVRMLLCRIFTLPRTLKKASNTAIASCISILLSAVLIARVGVGVEGPGNGKVDGTAQSLESLQGHHLQHTPVHPSLPLLHSSSLPLLTESYRTRRLHLRTPPPPESPLLPPPPSRRQQPRTQP